MPEERTLREFVVDSIVFYDGSGHRLGPSECTLTDSRLIIHDARGGIHQILLRNISGITVPAPIISPKQLRINLSVQAYDVYCQTKDQTNAIAYWLGQAIKGSLSPESEYPSAATPGLGSAPVGNSQLQGSDHTQAQIPQVVSHRSPGLAIFLSFLIPGLGTMVNGKVRNGLLILVLYVLSVAIGVLSGSGFFFIFIIGIWVWGMVDAYRTAL